MSTSRTKSGATLVEVMVTVGILVTALIPMVGMLSMAIDNSGKAASNTIGSRIAAHVIGEVQQADWADVEDWDGRDSYYDDQGFALKGSNAKSESIYTARVNVGAIDMGMAASPGIPESRWQRQVTVMVASRPGDEADERLQEALNAIKNNLELPNHVLVSRALLINLEKPL